MGGGRMQCGVSGLPATLPLIWLERGAELIRLPPASIPPPGAGVADPPAAAAVLLVLLLVLLKLVLLMLVVVSICTSAGLAAIVPLIAYALHWLLRF